MAFTTVMVSAPMTSDKNIHRQFLASDFRWLEWRQPSHERLIMPYRRLTRTGEYNYPDILQLQIDFDGVVKLLTGLKMKASGLDAILCRMRHELATELAPILTCF